jgi:hypothetical protein
LTSRALFTKNSTWQARQWISHTNVTFTATAWKCAKASPKLWWQKNWLLLHDNALSHIFFITKERFTKNNMTVVPYPL